MPRVGSADGSDGARGLQTRFQRLTTAAEMSDDQIAQACLRSHQRPMPYTHLTSAVTTQCRVFILLHGPIIVPKPAIVEPTIGSGVCGSGWLPFASGRRWLQRVSAWQPSMCRSPNETCQLAVCMTTLSCLIEVGLMACCCPGLLDRKRWTDKGFATTHADRFATGSFPDRVPAVRTRMNVHACCVPPCV